MANKTDFLDLTLPANNEFNNTWDSPINENFSKVDLAIEDISNEIQSARFATTSLSEFLAVAHFSDGTLRPSDELDSARNSPVYGDDEGGEDFNLEDRLDKADFERYYAREGESDLLDNIARHSRDTNHLNTVLDGAKNNVGAPNFLSGSGSEFLLNGDPTPILFNLGGYLMELREDISVNVSGVDGTRYLYAERPSVPVIQKDRSTQSAGATTTNALNNDKIQVLVDDGQDFESDNVRAGMILRVTNTQLAGDYIIDEVGFDGQADQLKIIGIFGVSLASLNYQILDPLKPIFGVTENRTEAANRAYIGEGEFSSGSLISDIAYAFKGRYESPYQSIDVSTIPTQEVTLNHNLGKLPKKLHFLAAQNNDGSGFHEPLSTVDVDNDFDVTINNTLTYTPATFTEGVFDPGTTDASYTPASFTEGSLDGDVTGSLSGNNFTVNGVRVRFTKNQITIKNSRANLFYRDYDGTDQQTGFLKVVAE